MLKNCSIEAITVGFAFHVAVRGVAAIVCCNQFLLGVRFCRWGFNQPQRNLGSLNLPRDVEG